MAVRQIISPRRGGPIKLEPPGLYISHDEIANLNWAAAGHTIDANVEFPDNIYASFGDGNPDIRLGYWSVVSAGVLLLEAATDFAVVSFDGGIYVPLRVYPTDGEFGERMLDQSGNDSIKIPLKVRTPTGSVLPDFGDAGILMAVHGTANYFDIDLNSVNNQMRIGSSKAAIQTAMQIQVTAGVVAVGPSVGGTTVNGAFTEPRFDFGGYGLQFTSSGVGNDLVFSPPDTTAECIFEQTVNNDIINLRLNQSRDNTALTADDVMNIIYFGADAHGTTNQRETGAIVKAVADGTWSTANNDNPTRLEFYTQSDGVADGTTSPRVVVDSTGATKLGAPNNHAYFSNTGNVNFVGGAGLAYGSMYTNVDIARTLTNQNQFYEIDAAQAWTTGKVHNCTFADPEITVTNAGTYLITYTVSANNSFGGDEVEFGIMIDSTNTDGPAHGAAGVQNEGRSHRKYPVNDVGHQSGTAIIQLAAAKTISLAARNPTSAAKTITVERGNMTVLQIAGGSA